MDFFKYQDRARTKTILLLLYFILAVLGIVTTIYMTIMVWWRLNHPGPMWDTQVMLNVFAAVLAVVGFGSVFRIVCLASGGEAVASSLGGRILMPDTTGFQERRLLNVVEEMAIASGVPMPSVYLLDDDSINAFAAGWSVKGAVIGVTRGCIRYLNRDELQGVIAHEFSHILNGDMRLNIRLMGMIYGILLITTIGRILVNSRGGRDNKGNGGLVLLGLALTVIGYIGVLFGNMIKSAVSREREFLADASAVQFTRNPQGLAGCLKKIGGLSQGSIISHPRAEEVSHMFFAEGLDSYMHNLFATHPPLVERIKRLDPSFEGSFPRVNETVDFEGLEAEQRVSSSSLQSGGVRLSLSPQAVVAQVGNVQEKHLAYARGLNQRIPADVRRWAEDPLFAQGLILSFFLKGSYVLKEQLALLESKLSGEVIAILPTMIDRVSGLSAELRLPIIGLTFPALKTIKVKEYQCFKTAIMECIAFDRVVSISEYVLSLLVFQVLDRKFIRFREPRVRYREWVDITTPAQIIFSSLARYGHVDGEEARSAFRFAANQLPSIRPLEFIPKEECSVEKIHFALSQLEFAAPQLKKALIKAATDCVLCDDSVTVDEAEILRAFALVLDCPLPPFFEFMNA